MWFENELSPSTSKVSRKEHLKPSNEGKFGLDRK